MQSCSAQRKCCHSQRPRDRIQFGEAGAPAQQVEDCPLGSRLELSLSSPERRSLQWCQQHPRARKIQCKYWDQLLNKDRTRFTKLFHIVLLRLLSIVVRIVPITEPRHGKSKLLESLHVETDVVRTSAALGMTSSVEFCHCVHSKCCERGASMAFASGDCRKRRLSRLVTSAMPSCAARLAETNRFPLSVRSRLEEM